MLSEKRIAVKELFPTFVGGFTREQALDNEDTLRVRILPEDGLMEIEVVAEDGFIAGCSCLNPARWDGAEIVLKPHPVREGMRQTYFVGLAY